MPIKLTILQFDSDLFNIESEAMAMHGVDVTRSDVNNLENIAADAPQIVLLASRRTATALVPGLQQVRDICPECKIVVWTECCTSQVFSCIRLGVTGVLCSPCAPARLAEVIRLVLDGEYYLDNDIAQILAIRHIKKNLEPFAALSSREFDVFCLLAEGCNLQIISEHLGISQKTVSNCQTQLKLKLAIKNRMDLSEFAKRHGLIVNNAV